MLMNIGTPFSHDLLAHAGVIVVCDIGSRRTKSHVVQLCLGTDDHSTLSGELEVSSLSSSPTPSREPTWKLALGVPR